MPHPGKDQPSTARLKRLVQEVAVRPIGGLSGAGALAAEPAEINRRVPGFRGHSPPCREVDNVGRVLNPTLHRLASTLLPLYQQPSSLERVVHQLGAPLVWLYWRLTELLLYLQCRLGTPSGSVPT